MESIANTAMSGNSPIAFTWFGRKDDPAGARRELTWRGLCSWIETAAPIAATKDDLPLFKLATFAGDYRSNDTLETVSGIEGDYDGEVIQPDAAATLLQAACIASLIYTTPSHRPDAPRWRVLCPLSRPMVASERHAVLARLNGALGGILAVESFVPSQAYYVGASARGEPVQSWRVEGRCIDAVDGITPQGPSQAGTSDRIAPGARNRAPSYAIALKALQRCNPGDNDRGWWLLLSGSFYAATVGLVDDAQALADYQKWNIAHGETNDPAANARTWAGFARSGTKGDFGTLARLSGDPQALAWHYFKGAPLADRPIRSRRPANDPASFFVRIADMVARPPVFLVDGILEVDSLAVLFGDPASGKSLVAIDIAASVATGHPFHDHAVRAGSVFYIAGEGKNGLRRRFAAWEELTGCSIADAPLYASQAAVRFLDSESAAMVTVAIEGLAVTNGPPRLIVVDTLARNFGDGDENAQRDMTAFVAALDRLREQFPGSTVLLVHHSGHGDKDRARGSSVLRSAVDSEYKVSKEGEAVHLTNHKMKDAAPPLPMAFAIIQTAGSVALEYTGEPNDRSGKRTATQTMTLEAFDTAATDGRVTIEAWRTAFYGLNAGSDEAKRKAFTRGREWTIQSRVLQSDDAATYERAPMPGMMPIRSIAVT